MTPLAWILIGHTTVLITALVCAVAAWRHAGDHMRHARHVVQAHAPVLDRVTDRLDATQPDLPTIAADDEVWTDPTPTGIHPAIPRDTSATGMTDVLPITGDLDTSTTDQIRIPPYIREGQ